MSHIKTGMNLFLWTDAPKFSEHEGLLRFIKEVGFDGVEFPVENICGEDLRAFSNVCDSLGLERTAVAVFNPAKYDPISQDKAMRRAAVDAISEWCDKTLEIGASLLSGPFFQGLGKLSGAPVTEWEWRTALETLGEACGIAGDKGVRIALEPLNRFEMYFANTLADAQRFVRELGLTNVGILGDTMHSNIEELDVAEAYRNALPELMHVHVSESTRGTPGSGHGVPEALFGALIDGGYEGWLTIEAFSGGVTPSMIPALCLWRNPEDGAEEIARKGLAYIKKNITR